MKTGTVAGVELLRRYGLRVRPGSGSALALQERREGEMLDGYRREEVRQAIFDLAEATMAVTGETRLVHAAATRVVETRRRSDSDRFLRHLARLEEAERVRISRRRDAIVFERWTRAAFGTAELQE